VRFPTGDEIMDLLTEREDDQGLVRLRQTLNHLPRPAEIAIADYISSRQKAVRGHFALPRVPVRLLVRLLLHRRA
jgi:hypothetical protein